MKVIPFAGFKRIIALESSETPEYVVSAFKKHVSPLVKLERQVLKAEVVTVIVVDVTGLRNNAMHSRSFRTVRKMIMAAREVWLRLRFVVDY